ncbi:MAG: hypothetical protein COB43_02860 [Oceanospirillales bacterium]|nr:MAG: hypothetical protein COB43_02860 [Oceanospirillales bacterium]
MATKDNDMAMPDEEMDNETETDLGPEEEQDEAPITDVSFGSAEAHRKLRESLDAEVAAFLARGGQIKTVDDNVMGDPPRKPQTSYGSRPI